MKKTLLYILILTLMLSFIATTTTLAEGDDPCAKKVDLDESFVTEESQNDLDPNVTKYWQVNLYQPDGVTPYTGQPQLVPGTNMEYRAKSWVGDDLPFVAPPNGLNGCLQFASFVNTGNTSDPRGKMLVAFERFFDIKADHVGKSFEASVTFISSSRYHDLGNTVLNLGRDKAYAEIAFFDANGQYLGNNYIKRHGYVTDPAIHNQDKQDCSGLAPLPYGSYFTTWQTLSYNGTIPEGAASIRIRVVAVPVYGPNCDVKVAEYKMKFGENHWPLEYQYQPEGSEEMLSVKSCVLEGNPVTTPPISNKFWQITTTDASGKTTTFYTDDPTTVTIHGGSTKITQIPDVFTGDPDNPENPPAGVPTDDSGNARYVTVVFDPTDSATDATSQKRVFWVNPKDKVSLNPGADPVPKKYENNNTPAFTGWENTPLVEGKTKPTQYTQNTTIYAQYADPPTATGNDHYVYVDTPVGIDDLIPKIEIPEGSTPAAENGYKLINGPLDTSQVGNDPTAQVEITYEDGSVGIVEVPIHIWPLVSNEEPTPPEDSGLEYVKVTFDPTADATNPNAKKEVWVAKGEDVAGQVTPPTENPVGKTNDEGGVHVFTGWEDIPSKFDGDTIIPATYKIVKPKPDLVPVGTKYDTPDKIKKLIDLPEGVTIVGDPVFKDGGEPNTENPGSTEGVISVTVTDENGNQSTIEITTPITVVSNVVEQEGDEKPDVPDNYVEVVLKPTDEASDATKQDQHYWVNPDVEVTITPTTTPVAKEAPVDRPEEQKAFIGWDKNLTQQFTDPVTEITALYTTPTLKHITVDPNDEPEPSDFVENIPLPDGWEIPDPSQMKFKDPDEKFDEPGEKQVELIVPVKDPNGNIVEREIKVPVKIWDNVVPVEPPEDPAGEPERPEGIPDDYILVTVDPTDKAVEEDRGKTYYFVNPGNPVELETPDDPKGKKDGEYIQYDFREWGEGGSTFDFDSPVTFEPGEDVTIEGVYNVIMIPLKPLPYPESETVITPIEKAPTIEDYTEKVDLPEGSTIIEITKEPDVSKPGDSTAKVRIRHADGSITTVEVPVRIVPNVVPGEPDGSRPAGIPDDYVRVTVVPTDKATDPTKEYFWVNPDPAAGTDYTIPANKPTGKVTETYIYSFTGWDKSLTGPFTEATIITAQYRAIPNTSVSLIETTVGEKPTEEDLKRHIKVPKGLEITDLEVLEEPDVSQHGDTTARVRVTFSDGSVQELVIPVRVYAPFVPVVNFNYRYPHNLYYPAGRAPAQDPATATEAKVDAAKLADGKVATRVPATGEDRTAMLNTAALLVLTAGVLLVLRKRR